MGRPSLKEQRSAEILDAFGRCVARYGVEGSTLERIAEEAGVKRTILRHYVGNRSDLISALSVRIEREFLSQTEQVFEMLPSTGRLDRLIDMLFDPANQTDSNDVAIAQALISASELYADTATRPLVMGATVRSTAPHGTHCRIFPMHPRLPYGLSPTVFSASTSTPTPSRRCSCPSSLPPRPKRPPSG